MTTSDASRSRRGRRPGAAIADEGVAAVQQHEASVPQQVSWAAAGWVPGLSTLRVTAEPVDGLHLVLDRVCADARGWEFTVGAHCHPAAGSDLEAFHDGLRDLALRPDRPDQDVTVVLTVSMGNGSPVHLGARSDRLAQIVSLLDVRADPGLLQGDC